MITARLTSDTSKLLDAVGRQIQTRAEVAIRKTAEDIAADAAHHASSGRLKQAIVAREGDTSLDAEVTAGGHDTALERAGFFAHLVEFGDSNQPAEPFMGPAAQRGEATAAKNMGTAMRRVK